MLQKSTGRHRLVPLGAARRPGFWPGFFEYWFMFWLRRHLPAKQSLNSKQSAKGYERIIWDIWLLYMSSSLSVRPQRKYRAWHYSLLTQQKLSKVPYFLYFQDDNGRTSYVKLLYEFMDYFWKIPIRFSSLLFKKT